MKKNPGMVASLCLLLASCCSFAADAPKTTLPTETLTITHQNGKAETLKNVAVVPKDFHKNFVCAKTKEKAKSAPKLKTVQNFPCILCNFNSASTEVTFSSVYQGSDGNPFYQFKALNHLQNGTVQDVTADSYWANNNPTAFALRSPGVYEVLQTGVVINEFTTIYFEKDDCNSGCYYDEVNVDWYITTAITFSGWNGSTVEGMCGLKVSPGKQTCGVKDSCTPATTPSMTSGEGNQVVGICIPSSDSCPADQGWSTLSYCWGYFGQGPFCSVIPFIGSDFHQKIPGACTPLSEWPK